ncbi:MAG: PGPGW domain-containing protein [Halofilum sp. (in: g-proteobacteria)]|nr:PGPGW domain-containing protein [Halofilum sp. (in: g-proteobacteria)]
MRDPREPHDPHDPLAEASPSPDTPSAVDQFVRMSLRQIRRLAILLVGLTVVLIGLVMLVTPGPALVVVPVGLAILAIEFTWARRLLRHVRERAARIRSDYWGRRW